MKKFRLSVACVDKALICLCLATCFLSCNKVNPYMSWEDFEAKKDEIVKEKLTLKDGIYHNVNDENDGEYVQYNSYYYKYDYIVSAIDGEEISSKIGEVTYPDDKTSPATEWYDYIYSNFETNSTYTFYMPNKEARNHGLINSDITYPVIKLTFNIKNRVDTVDLVVNGKPLSITIGENGDEVLKSLKTVGINSKTKTVTKSGNLVDIAIPDIEDKNVYYRDETYYTKIYNPSGSIRKYTSSSYAGPALVFSLHDEKRDADVAILSNGAPEWKVSSFWLVKDGYDVVLP